MKRVALVIGPARAGKSTVARSIAAEVDGNHKETSASIIRAYERVRGQRLTTPEMKEAARADLEALGQSMANRNPAQLVQSIVAEAFDGINSGFLIISGVRRRIQIEESLAWLSRLHIAADIIFVERPGFKSPEDGFDVNPTTPFQGSPPLMIINDATLADLDRKAKNLAWDIVLNRPFGKTRHR